MATKEVEKTPLHKHEHPAYPWVALIFAVVVVLGVAGWWVLTTQTTLDEDVLQFVKSKYNTTEEVNTTTTDTADTSDKASAITTEINSINKVMDNISVDDYSSTKLDNTSVGL